MYQIALHQSDGPGGPETDGDFAFVGRIPVTIKQIHVESR
jgi:hypothetical protein